MKRFERGPALASPYVQVYQIPALFFRDLIRLITESASHTFRQPAALPPLPLMAPLLTILSIIASSCLVKSAVVDVWYVLLHPGPSQLLIFVQVEYHVHQRQSRWSLRTSGHWSQQYMAVRNLILFLPLLFEPPRAGPRPSKSL
jgi:hypothetical protein